MRNNPTDLERIRQVAELVVAEYIKLPEILTERGGREGGYMTILNAETNRIEAIFLIGSLPDEKVLKCLDISQEKARRLYEMVFNQHLPHLTSWESRNPGSFKFGGAIYFPYVRFENYILSISGLPELGDEVCMLCTKVFSSSDDKQVQTSLASSMLHSIYFKEQGHPGQEQFRALLGAFDVKI